MSHNLTILQRKEGDPWFSVGNFSASIVLASVNVYDKFNGVTTSKSAFTRGLAGGIFKDKNYYGVYWFDRNKELGFKNAFGIVYNRYF